MAAGATALTPSQAEAVADRYAHQRALLAKPVPKSSTPVRLQAELMQRAAQAGARHHRRAAQQAVFAALHADRLAGAWACQVSTAAERLGPDGSRCIGRFQDGAFQPLEPRDA